jgi:type IV secretory pathway TrbD component
MPKGRETIPGFQEEIHLGVWHRHEVWGASRKWVYAWMAVCGFVGAHILFKLPFGWLFPWVFVWMVGHGVLVLLTQWDDRWDDVLLASWRHRKYKKRYEAG